MRNRKVRLALSVVLPLVLLLTLTGVALAQWNVLSIVDAWDDSKDRYESGNAQMFLDGSWESMHHDFFTPNEFDTTDYPNACAGGLSSDFAGQAEFALDHTDNAPMGAEGFQSTRNWALVRCSNLHFNDPQVPDKQFAEAADIVYTCTPDNNDGDIDTCEIVSQDVPSTVGCNDSNCYDEIITTVRVNLDTNCDGAIEPQFQNVDLCLYWEAEKPSFPADVYWQGNIQVHVDQGGGRKTINFAEPAGPNAVGIQSFAASPIGAAVNPLAVVLTLVLVAMAGVVWAWRSARG